MLCELDADAPGPCVLQSPTVSGSDNLGFSCVEVRASSDNIVFELRAISGAAVSVSRKVTLQYAGISFTGIACVPVPTTSEEFYRIRLTATNHLSSPSSVGFAEVYSFSLKAADLGNTGSLYFFTF
jgi:hypothetical protein